MIIEPLGIEHILATSEGSATDIDASNLVLLTNVTQDPSTNANNAYVFVVDPNATGENQLIHKYPLGNRNSMIIRKRPTDKLCASSSAISNGSGNIAINLNIDVRANPICFQDTQNQIDPSTFGVRGETSSSDQTIDGMSGLSEINHHGNVLCGPSRALDVKGANLVLVTNVTGQKMALTMLDANDVQIGQIMIPRYGQVKVRKNTTDKLFGSVSILGPAYGNYVTVQPGLTFMPIGFTN